MLIRTVAVFALALALVFSGCGGSDEVKKNEGVIVNTMPGAERGPGGPAPNGGAPGSGGPAPATPTAQAPPVPVPGSK